MTHIATLTSSDKLYFLYNRKMGVLCKFRGKDSTELNIKIISSILTRSFDFTEGLTISITKSTFVLRISEYKTLSAKMFLKIQQYHLRRNALHRC